MPKTFFYTIALSFYIALVGCAAAQDVPQPATPILRGHAHNDYAHPRPLLDALDNGFCSVEADIFLINDALYVAHFFFQIRPQRTLESLYLEPLRERTRQLDGKIVPDAERFYLWIELKTEAQSTYNALKKVLEKYADILTRFENDKVVPGAVTVILTGNAHLDLIRNEPVRYACVDGGLGFLDSDVSAHFVPVVSLDWRREFPRFRGELSPAHKEKLAEHVRKAHERGRKLRYWNAPDNEEFWKILYDADVDLINTDRLEPLRKFLMKQNEDR
jgi:hypothetical protein